MKHYFLYLGLACLVVVFGASFAYAATPTIAVISYGNNDTVQVNVQGDPFSSVSLSYYPNSSSAVPTSVGTIGTTNASGTFNTTMMSRMYGIPTGALAYVTVNNQRSQVIVWPNWSQVSLSYAYNGVLPSQQYSYGYPQPYNYYASSYQYQQPQYYSSYQYPYNQQYQYSYQTTYPYQYNAYVQQPASIYGSFSSMSVSPSSLSVQAGQTVNAAVSGGFGQLYIQSTTNVGVVSATISGRTLSVTGLTPGSSTITIGSYGGDAPVSVSVTVSGGYNYYSPYYPYLNQSQQYYYPYSYANNWSWY